MNGHLPELKILHVIQSLDERQGGTVSVLKGLALSQVVAGHHVAVYTTAGNNDEPSAETFLSSGGVAVFTFPVLFRPMLFSWLLYTHLRNRIVDYDMIHIHGLYRFPVTYAAWLARARRLPCIICPHGSLDPFLYKQSRFGKWAVPLKRLYERLFDIPNLHQASAILYTAKEEMERAAFLELRAPAVIIPNGINWSHYASLPERGAFRNHIKLNACVPLVLFLGRINFKKGLDLLVPAFARVLKKVPEARLALVGPDNDAYGLKVQKWCWEQGIADKVIFAGYLGLEKVKQAYVDADVFVLPSYTENFGMTVVEAMACGCPVVISDQVNIWREVKEDGAGRVVGLDPLEIAEAICRVLQDKKGAEEMGRCGRLAAERCYSWPQIVEPLTDVYRKLIEANAARHRTGN